MYSLLSWKDIKEPTDYLYEKYVKKQGRRMYLYGVSLGGAIQTHYLINENDNVPYSGVVSYGNVFAPTDTIDQFKKAAFGLYDMGLGFFWNQKIRELLPDLAKHSSQEQVSKYTNGLYHESYRLTSIDTHVIAPMFGFKDSTHYYQEARISGKLHKITKCPVMFLQAWDDVLNTPEAMPVDEIRQCPNILLACTR